jgi:hypothetical protein
MMNFKVFNSTGATLAGIELAHLIRQIQFIISAFRLSPTPRICRIITSTDQPFVPT